MSSPTPPPAVTPSAASPPGPPAGTPQVPRARPVATSLGLLVPLLSVVALLLLVIGIAGAGLRWLLLTPEGAAWVLARVPVLQVSGFQGTLLGSRWQADRVQATWDGGRASVTLQSVEIDGLHWRWRPHDEAWVGLEIGSLQVRQATLQTGPPGPRPIVLPASLAPPVQLALQQARIGTLQVDALAPIEELRLQDLQVQAEPGAPLRLAQLALVWQGVRAQAGLSLGTTAPYPLQLQGQLRPVLGGDAPAWAAVLALQGPLAEPRLQAQLRGPPLVAGRPAPVLDVQAGLRPLQRWPLADLALQTEALDLSALHAAAPQTALSGSVRISSEARDAPISADLRLDNGLPGRANEGRLPLRRLRAELQGRLDQPDRLALPRFELELADASGAAGRWTGQALWQGSSLTLDTQVTDLQPQRLDGRAAAMRLSGPVALRLQGLPSPGPAAPAAAPAGAAASAAGAADVKGPLRASWQLDLQGRLDAAPQAVQLKLAGSADANRIELRQATARSGEAQAEFSALLQRGPRLSWQVQSQGRLADFDPLPWFPGPEDSAWRRGRHRLSAQWELNAQLPSDAAQLARRAPIALAQGLAGNGRLQVSRSLLAGVPVAADVTLRYSPAEAPTPAMLHGELQIGGNRLLLDGRGDPAGEGGSDRLRLELAADQLTALAPLLRLSPGLAGWVPSRGSLNATLSADGRWPRLRTEGQARVLRLQAADMALQDATLSWQLNTGGNQPVSVQARVQGLQWGGQRLEQLRADVAGTTSEHRLSLTAALPWQPPAEALRLMGLQARAGTNALLQGRGQWQPAAGGGGRWQGLLDRLDLGAWDGRPDSTEPGVRWAGARDLRVELNFGEDGQLLGLQADPGRVQLADTAALQWDGVRLDLSGPRPDIELHARIEPFAVAPLLARLQPGAGWQGDLRLGARLDVSAAREMRADVVFERSDGDLHMAGSEGVQLMGLTEARLAVTARDGIWQFTPSFKGRSLGEISGSARVTTTAEQRWPPADSPLQGQVLARVADIGAWGAWVPPGWRLTGRVQATAELGGRFGDPRYTGRLDGSGLGVRNLLQGVNVRDGEIAVSLEGDNARVERFFFKGGEGTLELTGNATLGAAPQARLTVRADRFRLLARVDRNLSASGDAELHLTPAQGRLDGKLRIDEGFFDLSSGDAPSLDEDVTLRGAQEPAEAADERKGAPTQRRNFVLGLDLNLGDKLQIRGRGLNALLKGQLRLTTPGGRLAVNGTIDAEGGSYRAYGQQLSIERGLVAFNGPANNPRLDVLALRPNLDVRVGVLITGSAQTPRVRLFSEPELTDSEKLSWLVLGRAPDGLGRSDTALLQRAAVALLAGEGEAPTDTLLKNLGIDELSLRQGDNGDVRETVITLGKQLSRRWYVGYERSVNATAGTWQLIYRIAQRFTLRAQTGGLDSSLDVIWVWRAQETPADAGMRKSTLVPP